MTKVLDQTAPTGESRLALFRLLNPPTGANTVSIGFTITLAPTPNSDFLAGAISLDGNDPTTPEAQMTSTAGGSGTTFSASLSGVTSLTLGAGAAGSNMTAQTQTLTFAINQDNNAQAGNLRASRSVATGTVAHGFTISVSDQWIAAEIEVAAAPAAPPVTLWLPRRMPLGV
jgi:hypothetical protein